MKKNSSSSRDDRYDEGVEPRPETEPTPVLIYWTVMCPDCDAAPLYPCQDDGKIVPDDVHLGRAEMWVSARFEFPERGLKWLSSLKPSEPQP